MPTVPSDPKPATHDALSADADNRSPPRVDVIVRTLANTDRRASLVRALDSIRQQPGVDTRTILVINGGQRDPEVMAMLSRRTDVAVREFEQANAGRAILAGYAGVAGDYFTFLDDDDEFLPGALAPLFDDSLDWDVLVTAGYRRTRTGVHLEEIGEIRSETDPLEMLFDENWLAPGRTFYRTATFDARLLDVSRAHHEWTQIAFRVATSGCRIQSVNRPISCINDTEGSASKSFRYRTEELRLFEEIETEIEVEKWAKRRLRDKRANLRHCLAVAYLDDLDMANAWRLHLKSMTPPYTLRYLLFTRKLLSRRRSRASSQLGQRS